MPQYVDVLQVQERLDEVSARLDVVRGGLHRFNNIRPYNNAGGANWTASYGARRTTILRDAVMLTEMRNSLLRVQAEFPLIRFAA